MSNCHWRWTDIRHGGERPVMPLCYDGPCVACAWRSSSSPLCRAAWNRIFDVVETVCSIISCHHRLSMTQPRLPRTLCFICDAWQHVVNRIFIKMSIVIMVIRLSDIFTSNEFTHHANRCTTIFGLHDGEDDVGKYYLSMPFCTASIISKGFLAITSPRK